MNIEQMKAASIRRIKGPTILLGSGTYYDFEDPENSEITIEDIAFGLAYTARFAGQTFSPHLNRRVMYVVAEHCVRGSYAAEANGRPDLALQFLMHETGEPVCGDMTGPLKSLCPEYKSIEKRCEAANAARFGIVFTDPAALKLIDLRMLATERRDLMRWGGEEWEWVKGAEPYDFKIIPWGPDEAANRFLERYWELTHRA